MKHVPTFKIELLSEHKKNAHKILKYTPDLFSYSSGYLKEKGEILKIEDFLFVQACEITIDQIKNDEGLIEFKDWVKENSDKILKRTHYDAYHWSSGIVF